MTLHEAQALHVKLAGQLIACRTCGVEQPPECFRVANPGFPARRKDCRKCCAKVLRMWKSTPSGRASKKRNKRADYERRGDAIRQKEKERRIKNPDWFRNYELQRNFGIGLEEFNAMAQAQGNVCAICAKPCATHRRLSVDHCHSTGRIRKLLCVKCNTALGAFGDSIELMEVAIKYIRDHSCH